MTKSDIRAALWALLRSFEFRHWFTGVVFHRRLGWQIRQMRLARGWSRSELARRTGLNVATVIRNEMYACGKIKTLIRFAHAFDVAIIGRFVSWSEFVDDLLVDDGVIPTFDEEFPATGEPAP